MISLRNDIYKNWNKTLYIANKSKDITLDQYNDEIVTYEKPFYFGKVNYQPLTGKNLEAFMKEYGETDNNIVSCLIDYNKDNQFKQFDLAYLYGANPTGESINGENANYVVKAYKRQNTKIMVLFEEIIKE